MAALTWSSPELAAELGVSEWLVRHHVEQIPHLWIGQRLVFPKAAIARWLEQDGLTALSRTARVTPTPDGSSPHRMDT